MSSAIPLSSKSIRRRSRQRFVDMWRETVLELAGVRRQVYAHLLEIVHDHFGRRLVATELLRHQPLTLLGAADNRPHN